MQKTRDPKSELIHNAKTVIIDHDGNYHCYIVELEDKDLKKFIFEIAENDYTIFSDLKIINIAKEFEKHIELNILKSINI